VPGGKVFLPHTITNTGNGADSYNLTVTEGAGDFNFLDADPSTAGIQAAVIFPDADLDGVADSTTPIAVTPVLAPGEVFGVVLEANVPATASPTDEEELELVAASVLDPTAAAGTDTNTDTITVTDGAVTEIQKSMVVTTDTNGDGLVGPGDVVTITITYDSTR